MHENKYNNYRIPAGLLITFLEKALLLIHMETHLNDVRDLTLIDMCYPLISPSLLDIIYDEES